MILLVPDNVISVLLEDSVHSPDSPARAYITVQTHTSLTLNSNVTMVMNLTSNVPSPFLSNLLVLKAHPETLSHPPPSVSQVGSLYFTPKFIT